MLKQYIVPIECFLGITCKYKAKNGIIQIMPFKNFYTFLFPIKNILLMLLNSRFKYLNNLLSNSSALFHE